jgi:hypothetical protein
MLGRKDSNPRLTGPKPAGLPLADAPVDRTSSKYIWCTPWNQVLRHYLLKIDPYKLRKEKKNTLPDAAMACKESAFFIPGSTS